MGDEIRVSEDIEVGDLGVGEPDTANETMVEPDVTEVFDVVVDTDETDHSRDDEFAMDVLQASAASVAEDGTIVADVVTAVVDEESGVAMIDEVVGVVTPDGTEIADERMSVIDPEGNFAVVGEEIEVTTN
jgi:hypothetical protein